MQDSTIGKERFLLPRWRDFETTRALGELGVSSPTTVATLTPIESFSQLSADWEKNKSMSFAADLVCAAVVSGQSDAAKEAAFYILEKSPSQSDPIAQIARRIVGTGPGDQQEALFFDLSDTATLHSSIHFLRHLAQLDPLNAITQVELARIYTILGQLEKANRAIDVALKLAPENRFTVRSAARFFVHVDDLEKAEWILKKSQRVHVDPWLLSTHISIAQLQDKAVRFGREASSMINSGSHAPLHVAELAAVLGNVELANGKVKNARRLFQKSLVKPTENAVAQVVTVARLIARTEYLKSEFHVQRPFEAKAKAHVFLAEWDRVFAECELWLCDEPFSTEPALLGSYISSCLTNDSEKALSILEKALRANASDPALLNNKAFSLIESNQLEEAKSVLEKTRFVGSSSASSVALKATEGLLEYRSGNSIRGAVLYGLAADLAKTSQNLRSQILVELFHARERIRMAPTKSEEIVSQIESLVRKSADPDIPFLMKKLREQGGRHRRDPVNRPSNREKRAGD